MNGPTHHLYISVDLHCFAEPLDTALGFDVTQADSDCKRAYRRVDSKWWSYLARHHAGYVALAALREALVAQRGEDAIAKAESLPVPNSYQPPRLTPSDIERPATLMVSTTDERERARTWLVDLVPGATPQHEHPFTIEQGDLINANG